LTTTGLLERQHRGTPPLPRRVATEFDAEIVTPAD
jgi:hypothetical protein